MKKTLAGIALAGILTMSAGTMAAQAAPSDPYPAGAPASTVSTGTLTPGEALDFNGSGFIPGESIDITIVQTSTVAGGALGSMGGGISASVPIIIKPASTHNHTVTADANGAFATSISMDQTGTYTLAATGRTSGVTVSQVVKVVTSNGAGAGGNGSNAGSNNGNNAAGSNDGLASTGLDASVLVWSLVGVGALGAGVGTVVVSRRRNRQSANA
ncbi:LPXTG cell wall anchor domain-containing protein [Arthrobacter sp. LAPM80]|uniref:LPXTG cell wall anchor domain-containing protein n=1 Tax=Arthrobacter sp. LAPM80 TaxID=3141788 RepID=UPI00398B3A32